MPAVSGTDSDIDIKGRLDFWGRKVATSCLESFEKLGKAPLPQILLSVK